ncbi:MAG TPA: metallophosphoesterase [Deltaproteobacteria bacterium]|nr:metallophosphoesterase [Deltaproteobacteria bacterium]
MQLFLLAVFGIYGAVHVYAFLRARAAFPCSTGCSILLGLLLAAMTLAPILVRVLERHGLDGAARSMSWIGYTWMGVIFLFFSLSVLTDAYRLLVHGASLFLPGNTHAFLPSPRQTFLIPLVLALAVSVLAYHEALKIRIETLTIRSPRVPAEVGRLRITQISDVHLGLIVREGRLRRMLEIVRSTDPDILVSTGDLVDGQIDSISGLAKILGELRPRHGKYAVTGNHEFYAGLDHALEVTRAAGFTMLRNQAVQAAGFITIAGADDPTGIRFGSAPSRTEQAMLSGLHGGTFTVLLKHMPMVRQDSAGRFDLQLSGHTHRGQIFPFVFAVRLFFDHIAGNYDLPGGAILHVSRGTGTWGPPMRFLAPPEITVIDLVHDPGQ